MKTSWFIGTSILAGFVRARTHLDARRVWLLTALLVVLYLLPAGRVTAQTFTTLHSFAGSDGANPVAGLITNSSGNTMYGTTAGGGSGGSGTVFAINTDGTGFTNLHSFTGSDGANPWSGLILSGHTLYGTTVGGGDWGGGTVFAVNTDGTGFTNLHGFKQFVSGVCDGDYDCAPGSTCLIDPYTQQPHCSQTNDAAYPNAGLILKTNTLYGTASSGGLFGFGAVFAVNTDGTGFTNVHNFASYDGANPVAGLILSGDTLYGTTAAGGTGNGTVFAVNTDGTGFTILYSFTQEYIPCLNGSCPPGYQCVGGVCVPGGGGGCPSCPQGSHCVCFADMHGNPIGCYCLTDQGGGGGGFAPGLIPAGAVTAQTFVSINFDGASPHAGLIRSGNSLYGTASAGGSMGHGTVFAVNTDGGGLTVLHNFTGGSDGANPWAGLVLSGNTLYGAANSGGDSGHGTVFAVNTDGSGFTNLYSFTAFPAPYYTNSDGANPCAGLLLSGNTLYGTAAGGGSSRNGTVFSLSLPGRPVVRCKNVTVSADVSCTANASIDDGSFSPNAGDTITLVQSPAGPYLLGDTSVTLTVTDIHGASNSCVATVTVVDTTPPGITCPGNIDIDATSPAGAMVSFSPAASDNCSLASVMSTPASGSTFAIGDTTVSCTATDGAGNHAACTFTVHVRGAAEQINNLIALIQSLRLHSGTANGLIVKLHGAARALDRGNIQAACGHLGAFLNEANAQKGKKLTAAQADLLHAEATRIRAVLGCR